MKYSLALAPALLGTLLAAGAAHAQTNAPWNTTAPGAPPSTSSSADAGATDAATPPASTLGAPTPGPTSTPPPQPQAQPAASAPASPAPPATGGVIGPVAPPGGYVAAAMDPRQLRRARRAAYNAARLHLLNSMLVPSLATRGRSARIQSGITNAVIGTGLGILGFFAPQTPYDTRPWFWAQAGVSMINAGFDLIWTPARETLPGRYNAMPMGTAHERRERIHFGEQALDGMAADAARRRLITGLVRVASSVAMLLIIYRDPIFNHAPFNPGPYDFLIIGYTGVDVITNVITAFSTAEEERLPGVYHERLDQIRAEQDAMYGTPSDVAPPASQAEVPPPAAGERE